MTNPLKLAALYKKLEAARAAAETAGQKWWLEWRNNGGSAQSLSDLNATCRKLDELAPGEGARMQSVLTLNALLDLTRRHTELVAEAKDMRKRLASVEEKNGQDIVRSSAIAPSEGGTLGESGGEGI